MARKDTYCPVEVTLDLIGNKWKFLILRELFTGKRRFGELYKAIAGITQKMLTQQLREMEKDGIVNRRLFAEVPPRVEYSLTRSGRSLRPVLNAMQHWGTRYMNK
ncbi:MAG TPA: helix-turn-helix domain-containing protein [Syntrophorhabdaceae bacterium]|nr:helix-turn-helix domain-containing protein [Syntrophorhabdaceae bacterium]